MLLRTYIFRHVQGICGFGLENNPFGDRDERFEQSRGSAPPQAQEEPRTRTWHAERGREHDVSAAAGRERTPRAQALASQETQGVYMCCCINFICVVALLDGDVIARCITFVHW